MVDPLELPRLPAAAADRAAHRQALALDDPELLVVTVRDEQPAAAVVRRDLEVPDRALAQRPRRDETFGDVLAVRPEQLNAVASAIRDVEKPVRRQHDRVQRSAA